MENKNKIPDIKFAPIDKLLDNPLVFILTNKMTIDIKLQNCPYSNRGHITVDTCILILQPTHQKLHKDFAAMISQSYR